MSARDALLLFARYEPTLKLSSDPRGGWFRRFSFWTLAELIVAKNHVSTLLNHCHVRWGK